MTIGGSAGGATSAGSAGGRTKSDGEAWDFFVSYTQADRRWAEWIAWVLEEAEYRVLVQAWDFTPGSNWVVGMNNGVRQSARTIAVLSNAYARSVYGQAEWQSAWSADPTGALRTLLVFRIEDCLRPGLLGQVVSIDLFGIPEPDARTALVSAARLAVSGARAKPLTPPPFPSGRAAGSPRRTAANPPEVGTADRHPSFPPAAADPDPHERYDPRR
ncbi:TIR domain-containing protein [Frankia sp. AiPs1]|uniref:toll/interleukin-1 receptor domain-containing protein n=1 Tax=Frankia sp. AiPa1 TaxID=573492 RepID=UPI00202B8C56|nr:toll/interleukin-1 receptor domain-containing protein [Frankia sp. AiPa1]MCL9760849.1 toll/interleukin-1 receptor domain-containing protein [Frankia sp. AiPa1]